MAHFFISHYNHNHSCFLNNLFQELNNFQNKCFELYGYDWIVVPLVYTQVLYFNIIIVIIVIARPS